MSVDALSSLIRTCTASNPAPAQTRGEPPSIFALEELPAPSQKPQPLCRPNFQLPQPVQCPPIASIGFWAQPEVPLSSGASSLSLSSQKVQMTTMKPEAVALPTMPLQKELQVRDRLAVAREMAGVGNDIRWDLIIEEASKMSCGLKAESHANIPKKALDEDDRRSTSASGSGGGEVFDETEVSSSDEIEETDMVPAILATKKPPWRRSQASTSSSQEKEPSSPVARVAPPPWRRTRTSSGDVASVYSLTTMLQCLMLMRQTSADKVPMAELFQDVGDQQQKLSPTAPAGFAAVVATSAPASTTSKKDAPWRRRARSTEEEAA